MIFLIVIQTEESKWQLIEKRTEFLNATLIFFNMILISRVSHRIVLINGKEKIFDSFENKIDEIPEILKQKSRQASLSSDIGFALCYSNSIKDESRIIVISIQQFNDKNVDKDENFRLMKCVLGTNKRIDALCLDNNKIMREASKRGLFCDGNEIERFYLQVLGTNNNPTFPTAFETRCYCHNEEILYGLICPICLAVYCKFCPVCKKCKTKFFFKK